MIAALITRPIKIIAGVAALGISMADAECCVMVPGDVTTVRPRSDVPHFSIAFWPPTSAGVG